LAAGICAAAIVGRTKSMIPEIHFAYLITTSKDVSIVPRIAKNVHGASLKPYEFI
jgi:hypothetical protein